MTSVLQTFSSYLKDKPTPSNDELDKLLAVFDEDPVESRTFLSEALQNEEGEYRYAAMFVIQEKKVELEKRLLEKLAREDDYPFVRGAAITLLKEGVYSEDRAK